MVIITACDLIDSKACTLEFRYFTLKVLDPQGQPANSVAITIYSKKDNFPFDPCKDSYCEGFETQSGSYIIFHDGLELNSKPETVIVEGEKDNLSFYSEHLFSHDGCHINKLSGPNLVTLAS